jgi:hypothetical protein
MPMWFLSQPESFLCKLIPEISEPWTTHTPSADTGARRHIRAGADSRGKKKLLNIRRSYSVLFLLWYSVTILTLTPHCPNGFKCPFKLFCTIWACFSRVGEMTSIHRFYGAETVRIPMTPKGPPLCTIHARKEIPFVRVERESSCSCIMRIVSLWSLLRKGQMQMP